MCQNMIKVRGVKVAGRQVYLVDGDSLNLTDCRVKLGERGPAVPYGVLLADLSIDAADRLAHNVNAIRGRLAKGDINLYELGQRPCTPSITPEASPVALLTADEPTVAIDAEVGL